VGVQVAVNVCESVHVMCARVCVYTALVRAQRSINSVEGTWSRTTRAKRFCGSSCIRPCARASSRSYSRSSWRAEGGRRAGGGRVGMFTYARQLLMEMKRL